MVFFYKAFFFPLIFFFIFSKVKMLVKNVLEEREKNIVCARL